MSPDCLGLAGGTGRVKTSLVSVHGSAAAAAAGDGLACGMPECFLLPVTAPEPGARVGRRWDLPVGIT